MKSNKHRAIVKPEQSNRPRGTVLTEGVSVRVTLDEISRATINQLNSELASRVERDIKTYKKLGYIR